MFSQKPVSPAKNLVRTEIFDRYLERLSIAEQMRVEEALFEIEFAALDDPTYGRSAGDGRSAPIDVFGSEFLVYWIRQGDTIYLCGLREVEG